MNSSKLLTRDGRLKMEPVFVQGGAELVYTVQESPTQLSLMRLRLADGVHERLHPAAERSEMDAAFAADGQRYAFVGNTGNLNLRVFVRDNATKKEAEFEPTGGFNAVRRPSLSPDGSRLIFSVPALNGQQIVMLELGGLERRHWKMENIDKYLTNTAINKDPAFSPDGREIVFVSSRDGHFEIYAMKADGSDVRRLTRSTGMNLRPAWSPDGKRIAFTSNRDGQYEIYVMNRDGSGLRRVTNHPERDDYACWHPDGRRLVMVCERAGRFDLHLVEVGE
jgi:TolB protein